MEHLTLPPLLSEPFKEKMLDNQWVICHQDAGQTHLVGWGYEITWTKEDALVTLRYSDKQGIATALLEVSNKAFPEIQDLVEALS